MDTLCVWIGRGKGLMMGSQELVSRAVLFMARSSNLYQV
jgi:hypothetical protein